ncbi:hypothetical protein, partial [Frateuria sp. Soil773]
QPQAVADAVARVLKRLAARG